MSLQFTQRRLHMRDAGRRLVDAIDHPLKRRQQRLYLPEQQHRLLRQRADHDHLDESRGNRFVRLVLGIYQLLLYRHRFEQSVLADDHQHGLRAHLVRRQDQMDRLRHRSRLDRATRQNLLAEVGELYDAVARPPEPLLLPFQASCWRAVVDHSQLAIGDEADAVQIKLT